MSEPLLNICEKGKVFYITTAFPPVPAGSSIINRNLLSKFDPSGFKVFTTNARIPAKVESFGEMDIERIFKSFYFSSKVNFFLSRRQISGATKKLVKDAERIEPKVLIGVFPDYYFLKITRDAAKELQIPFIAYLHDTIAESSNGSRLEKEAVKLQENVFSEASALLVMSEGMRELYKEKYNIESTPLQHTYLEKIPEEVPVSEIERQAFWGGDVYSINLNSVNRVASALTRNNCRFFLATGHDKEHFSKTGLNTENIEVGFFSKRKEYLEYLEKNALLVLALDWPDESKIHRDELATIFPTKTPEYLASGSPILVHCPEDYFMAQFFNENNCGTVVSTRSDEELDKTIKQILNDPQSILKKRKNALKTAEIFNSEKLAEKFKNVVDKVSYLRWSERINYNEV